MPFAQSVGVIVFQARSIGIEDFGHGCPISEDKLGRIYRAHADAIPDLVTGIPEHTRARLAAFLYARTHTRELGIRIAATCDQATLHHVAGELGKAIHRQSRQGYRDGSYGNVHRITQRGVSLAGSRISSSQRI
jgi:hypothetical protein